MARGDLTVFDNFADQLGSENHVFTNGGDTIKVGIVDNTLTPTQGFTNTTWGVFSANEVSTAGGYTAGGETLANQSYTETGGVGTFDADDVTISQDGSGFTDGYWAILYNDTNASNAAFAFVDLGGPVSEQAGEVKITWNASGIFTITVS
jgi:hypothetical protein